MRKPNDSAWTIVLLIAACLPSACSRQDVAGAERTERVAQRLENGDFEGGTDGWWAYPGDVADSMTADSGELCVTVPAGTANPWDAGVGQGNLTLVPGQAYEFAYTVRSTLPASIRALVQEPADPFGEFVAINTPTSTEPVTIEQTFVMGTTDQVPQLAFQVGGGDEEVTFCFDDVRVEPAGPANLVQNGSFDAGLDGWWTAGAGMDAADFSTGSYCVEVPAGVNQWDAQLGQGLSLQGGASYEFSFFAQGDAELIHAIVQDPSDFSEAAALDVLGTADGAVHTVRFALTEDLDSANVIFQVGSAAAPWNLCLDDVTLVKLPAELVQNGSFDAGLDGWWTNGVGMDTPDLSDGRYCVLVPGGGGNIWDVQLGQDIAVQAGVSYTFSFEASGDPGFVHAVIQNPPANYAELGVIDLIPTADTQHYETTFTVQGADAPEAKLLFQVGGQDEPWNLCIDEVSLEGGAEAPRYEPDTGPRVRVNQVAYLPHGPKFATLVTTATESVEWSLFDAGQNLVASGPSQPFGSDPSSGLDVHTIDFSLVVASAEGYTLVADGETSHPFAIGEVAYEDLRVDSLSFYYTQRSGVAIDGAIAGEAYARPAGHLSSPADGVVNQGDHAVPCQPADDSLLRYGEPWTCDYTLDVVGGWYDAGDHGKYVVNGGISVHQLLSAFERTKTAPTADLGALGDGSLRVPETGNGVPDVLDEVRQELEFFLSMMVPKGEPLAGMVHHKVHDNEWTGLPLLPHEDPNTRWLHRPSTAATLNVAATAAQGARIYAPYDRSFAKKLLKAARRAWSAALETPDLHAPLADGADGGGPYEDDDVSDEFYWAAAELYLTTGEREYEDFLRASPHHTGPVFTPAGFIWRELAALARIDLATIPSALPDRDEVVASVVEGAAQYLDHQAANGFGQPYLPANGVYVWGSNSQVLNNLVVLATAYDLSGDEAFRAGVLQGFDYLFGRNALNLSYVTGYGSVFSQNQHSRWYANQLDPSLPHPPVGSVAGGPNAESGTWDPTMQRLFGVHGCSPSMCYVDDIQSWSTNEITINWNSALAWVASFIADQDAAEGGPYGQCEVEVRLHGKKDSCDGMKVIVTNTGDETLSDWAVSWAHFGDQTIKSVSGMNVVQEGASVTVTPKGKKRKLKPGKSVTLEVKAKGGDFGSDLPGTFFLNGQACAPK